jgi:nitrogen-specific signal transduction histidine kinase
MLDLKTIIDTLPLSIFVVDSQCRILLSNRFAKQWHDVDPNENRRKLFGAVIGCTNTRQDAAGCNFTESCTRCQVRAMIEHAFVSKKNSDPFETEVSIRSMGVRCLRMTVSHISSDAMPRWEKEICVVTVEDVTERKKEVKLAAAVETIGGICHEFNQPLQAIVGSLALLTTCQLEDAAIARVEKINSEIERLKRITTKLMHITDFQTKPYLSANILDIERSASDITASGGSSRRTSGRISNRAADRAALPEW